ncbi:GFA family protein [Neorhizobium sp. T7_12]|uniref:GFA family protein n=1 Tax=Neorhizobium sp. T7_12 TaxID=2093832 RepID=UPI000CF892BB|nr:GFA family protein [Neorhizobium sp. T7_12]
MKRTAMCSCGKLSIMTSGAPKKVSICHCDACQRRTGSGFGIAVFFASEATEEHGHASVFRRIGDSGKSIDFHFCPACGSTVFWKPELRPGLTAIAFGCFDDRQGLEPSQSVYNDQRHAWLSLEIDHRTLENKDD